MTQETLLCVDIMVSNKTDLYDFAIGLPPSKKKFIYQNEKYIIDFSDNRNRFVWNFHFFITVVINISTVLLAIYLNNHFDINPSFFLVLLAIILIVLTSLFYKILRPTIRKRLLEEKSVIIKKE